MNIRQKICLILITATLAMAAACSSATPTPATMVGFWMDNNNSATTIQYQNGQYVAVTTYYMFASNSQNTLVSSSYVNGVLTWKYCPPARPCLTMQTVAFHGDTLDVNWTNDKGQSGQMTLTRTDKGQDNGN